MYFSLRIKLNPRHFLSDLAILCFWSRESEEAMLVWLSPRELLRLPRRSFCLFRVFIPVRWSKIVLGTPRQDALLVTAKGILEYASLTVVYTLWHFLCNRFVFIFVPLLVCCFRMYILSLDDWNILFRRDYLMSAWIEIQTILFNKFWFTI